ncbi:unnamed protein product, partial [Mesorhabditis spiculigera]
MRDSVAESECAFVKRYATTFDQSIDNSNTTTATSESFYEAFTDAESSDWSDARRDRHLEEEAAAKTTATLNNTEDERMRDDFDKENTGTQQLPCTSATAEMIFHLLKYDCWPRYLRAGGVAPEFSDEELADEEGRKDSARPDHDEAAGPSSTKEKGKWPFLAFKPDSPNNSTKDKRRSAFFERFRFMKGGKDGTRSSGAGSPVNEQRHPAIHRTSSSRAGSSSEDRRKSYSSELEDEVGGCGKAGVSSVGSRRRHLFTRDKQISMPVECVQRIARTGN